MPCIRSVRASATRNKPGDESRKSLLGFCFPSTPGRIRTCDLRIRSPLLYPAELRALNRPGKTADASKSNLSFGFGLAVPRRRLLDRLKRPSPLPPLDRNRSHAQAIAPQYGLPQTRTRADPGRFWVSRASGPILWPLQDHRACCGTEDRLGADPLCAESSSHAPNLAELSA